MGLLSGKPFNLMKQRFSDFTAVLLIERTFNSRINPESIVPTFFSDTIHNAKWRILTDAGGGVTSERPAKY